MNIDEHVIGVCSWSLQCKNTPDLVAALHDLHLEHVQLALHGLVDQPEAALASQAAALDTAGIQVTAGMIGFAREDYTTIETIRQSGGMACEELWPQRLEILRKTARIAQRLKLTAVSTHIGFVPNSNAAGYAPILMRVRETAQLFAGHDLTLLMETGQESASELLQFLNDVAQPNVGINFDPANMILYGAGNPIDAISILGRHVKHVHIKDALPSAQPGVLWGKEVPFGSGVVNAAQFLAALREAGYRGPLMIER